MNRAAAVGGWLRTWWPQLIAGLAFAVVAGVTGRVSYVHIQSLSLALHESPGNARIMPFGVDGLVIVGSVALLQAAKGQEWLGWMCIVPGALVSLFANFESEIRFGWLAASWAMVASMSFVVATFAFERWLKGQVSRVAETGPAGSPEPEAEAVSAGPEPEAAATPEPGEPVTPETALRALIGTGSRRAVADLLGVPKSRVDRWAATLGRPAGDDPAAVQDGPEETPELSQFEPAADAYRASANGVSPT